MGILIFKAWKKKGGKEDKGRYFWCIYQLLNLFFRRVYFQLSPDTIQANKFQEMLTSSYSYHFRKKKVVNLAIVHNYNKMHLSIVSEHDTGFFFVSNAL